MIHDFAQLVITVSAMLLIADLLVERFRKRIQVGQDVGIRFGDNVVNREVVAIKDTGITVRDLAMKELVEVPLQNVFMPDGFSPKNEVVEAQNESKV